MSSDDESDFLSSSDGLSDDDQTMQIPPGGNGTQPAKTTPTIPSAEATSPAASDSRHRQSHGNLLTDFMEYVTFAHCDTTPPAKIVKQKSIGQSRALSHETEQETTPLCHHVLNALEDGFTEPPPPDYNSLTPSAPIHTASAIHHEEGFVSAKYCQRQCCNRRCAQDEVETEADCLDHHAPVFRMLVMLVIVVVCLVIPLSVFLAP